MTEHRAERAFKASGENAPDAPETPAFDLVCEMLDMLVQKMTCKRLSSIRIENLPGGGGSDEEEMAGYVRMRIFSIVDSFRVDKEGRITRNGKEIEDPRRFILRSTTNAISDFLRNLNTVVRIESHLGGSRRIAAKIILNGGITEDMQNRKDAEKFLRIYEDIIAGKYADLQRAIKTFRSNAISLDSVVEYGNGSTDELYEKAQIMDAAPSPFENAEYMYSMDQAMREMPGPIEQDAFARLFDLDEMETFTSSGRFKLAENKERVASQLMKEYSLTENKAKEIVSRTFELGKKAIWKQFH